MKSSSSSSIDAELLPFDDEELLPFDYAEVLPFDDEELLPFDDAELLPFDNAEPGSGGRKISSSSSLLELHKKYVLLQTLGTFHPLIVASSMFHATSEVFSASPQRPWKVTRTYLMRETAHSVGCHY